MIPVKIQKISYHHPNRSYAVILKEIEGERKLPVLVGAFEAQAIAMAMEFMETPRPLTHDLIVNLINGIDGSLSSVKIIKLEDGVFYSILDLESKKYGSYNIDARPSDAIAISLRENAPILISETLIKNTSFQKNGYSKLKNNFNNKNLLSKLKIRLKNAVKNEKYEIAAEIRDKIKKIES